ncbi:MAG: amidohydrolase family protein [Haloferacaceae archaeon]
MARSERSADEGASDGSQPVDVGDGPVVDTDVHVGRGIGLEDVASRLDEPHRSRVHDASHGVFPSSAWDREMAGKIPRRQFAGADELVEQLCDKLGVDYPILNTTSRIPKLPDEEFAVALMRAYNDVLVEEFLDEYDAFRGLLTVATQRPEAAAAEVDRLGDEDQVVGLYVATGGPMYPLGDPRYDVLYEAAAEHDLTVAYHGHAGAFMTDFPRQNQAVSNFFTIHPLAHAWDQMLTVASLLGNGTPAKFPDLNFAFLEAGLGWFAYMMFRYNKEYRMRRSEVPLLDRSPEECMRDQFYVATQPLEEPDDPADLRHVIEAVGTENIMFSTDYPHWDFDNPETVAAQYGAAFSEAERRRVLAGNAAEAFGIDL